MGDISNEPQPPESLARPETVCASGAWEDVARCATALVVRGKMAKVIGNWVGALGYTNVLVFVCFFFWHDVIEKPNALGYFSLAVSLILFPIHYFSKGRDFQGTLRFSFFFCLGLIATLHNANFLVSTDYRGEYSVVDRRLVSHGAESWRLDLGNGKQIDLHVSSPPDGGGSDLRLKKGLFGVYFGIAVDDSSGQ